jgi:hypothetical protein
MRVLEIDGVELVLKRGRKMVLGKGQVEGSRLAIQRERQKRSWREQ